MADKPKGLYRLISLVFDSAASRKATREMEEALTRAGEVGGQGFQKELRKAYDKTIADAKVKLSQGLIDQRAFDRIKREADETFNRKLSGALQKLRAEGNLTEESFTRLSKSLKKVGDDGSQSMRGLEGGIAKVGAAIAAYFTLDKITGFFKGAVTGAMESEAAWNNLRSTVESAGVSFKEVSPELHAAADEWMRITQYDDEEFVATLQRLVAISGDYEGSLKNVLTVAGVAAKYFNGDLTQAATVVAKAMVGVTTGFGRMGIVIPEGTTAIDYFRDHAKEFIAQGLDPTLSRVQQLTVAWGEYNKALGNAVLGQDDAKESASWLTRVIRSLTDALDERNKRSKHSAILTFFNPLLRYDTKPEKPEPLPEPPAGPAPIGVEGEIQSLQQSAQLHELTAAQIRRAGELEKQLRAQVHSTVMEEDARKTAIEQIVTLQGIRESNEKKGVDLAKAREAQAAGEIAALENINSLGLLNDTQRARAYAIQKALTAEMDREVAAVKAGKSVDYERLKIVTDRLEKVNKIAWLSPDSATPHIVGKVERAGYVGLTGAGQMLGAGAEFERQKQYLDALTEYYDQKYSEIKGITENAAMGMANAFQDAFGVLMKEGATTGKFMEKLGRGIAGALLGGLAQYASTQIAKEVAEYFSDIAMAAKLAASTFAGNMAGPVGAAAYTASAHAHLLAIPKWAVLAGLAGAGQAAVAGGGGGGLSGGIPSGATDVGGRIATNAQAPGPEINIYVDGFDPHNPTHQQMVGYSQQELRERWGNDARITYHARTG